MKELALVIWLIGFPLSFDVSHYLAFKIGEKIDEFTETEEGFILIVWFAVALIIIFM